MTNEKDILFSKLYPAVPRQLTDPISKAPEGGTLRDEEEQEPPTVSLPISVGKTPLRVILSIDDAIDEIRRAEGEDPATGIVPVTEEFIDIELKLPDEDHSTVIGYGTWSNKERERLLSRLPCEGLWEVLVHQHGDTWWEHEPEVILEDLAMAGFILDAGGINKVLAFHALLAAPSGESPFYQDHGAFMFMAISMSGRPVTVESVDMPTPLECALAMHIANTFRPEPYSSEVKGCIAVCCYVEGIWTLPDILAVCQDKILKMAYSLDIPIDQDRVNRVRNLVAQELVDSETIPDIPDDPDEIQALRVIDLDTRIDNALARGDKIRDILKSKLSEY